MVLNPSYYKKNILHLIFTEEIQYLDLDSFKKETASDETPVPILAADEDEPIIPETPLVEYLDTIKPRLLRSKTDLRSISELNRVQTFYLWMN
ncbi:hypothetical protein CEXT_308491 [Caerostris extrusa]|uniref:Uncharacterized protein n=1 Tax=Caerostris extrusa TaxID=172846 RepID=A0AAV4Y966_CAEEX|nr:hypothetical protein CEXT_308491 [Caerostris extrusa]